MLIDYLRTPEVVYRGRVCNEFGSELFVLAEGGLLLGPERSVNESLAARVVFIGVREVR